MTLSEDDDFASFCPKICIVFIEDTRGGDMPLLYQIKWGELRVQGE